MTALYIADLTIFLIARKTKRKQTYSDEKYPVLLIDGKTLTDECLQRYVNKKVKNPNDYEIRYELKNIKFSTNIYTGTR
jgi:hypothetical protein